ncbi:histidine phosphatase family protein [Candidatus Saccharibacteria bacterium]|nr:histidine phosphatase family protein [Candidatus Saccharibacteria bacterium]
MANPDHLVLLRHGESEGNPPDGTTKHVVPNKEWELTDRGIRQIECAGLWLRKNFPDGFNEHHTSPLVRAVGSAFHLGLDASWQMDDVWRERSSGERDFVDPKIRDSDEFRASAALRSRDTYDTSYPGGELDVEVASRVKSGLDVISEGDADRSVLIVAHGHLMRGAQMAIESITGMEWMEQDLKKEPGRNVRNAQILDYTTVDPETGERHENFSFWRAVRTWRESGKKKEIVPDSKLEDDWHRIEKRRYTQDDLAMLLGRYINKRETYLTDQ